jgi:hypothetical protein
MALTGYNALKAPYDQSNKAHDGIPNTDKNALAK